MLIKRSSNIGSDYDLIVYNVALSQPGGRFTIDTISKKLIELGVEPEAQRMLRLVSYWVELGLIFDNFKEYVVNTPLINH